MLSGENKPGARDGRKEGRNARLKNVDFGEGVREIGMMDKDEDEDGDERRVAIGKG